MTHDSEAPALARGLFFSDADVPALRRRLEDPRYAAVWAGVVDVAKRVIAARSLLLEGDTFTIWYYARNRLMDLALYVLLTGDAAGAEALDAILLDLCARDVDFWQGPHYPNRPRTIVHNGVEKLAGELETAQLSMGIVIACDWAWSRLPESTRDVVLRTLEKTPRMLLRNSVDFQSEKWVMNHLCVLSTALVLASLLLGEEREPFRDDLAAARRGLELWMEKIEDDGSYGESYHYWAYPVNCLALGILSLKHALGVDLHNSHRVAPSLAWAVRNQVGKHVVAGFDRPVAAAVNNYDSPYLFQMEAPELVLFANYFKLPLAGWYIDTFLLDNPPRPDCLHHVWHASNAFLLALDDPDLPKKSPAELGFSTASHYADTGFVHFRDGWDKCGEVGGDTVFSLQSGGGGRSRSHEHYDKNSFSLYSRGEYFICDPGHSCYRGESHRDYDPRTRAHNTLCVAGGDQTLSFLEKGMLHDEARQCVSYNNQAYVTGRNFQKNISYVASEARRCYTPALNRFTRRVWYVRPHYFLIWDRVDASNREGEALCGFNLNNYDDKTRILENGNSIVVERPLADLQIEYLYPRIREFRREDAKLHLAYHILPDQAVEGEWGSALRLTPVPEAEVPNRTDYIYLLRPMDKGEKPARASASEVKLAGGLIERARVAIDLGDRNDVFAIDGEDVRYQGFGNEVFTF